MRTSLLKKALLVSSIGLVAFLSPVKAEDEEIISDAKQEITNLQAEVADADPQLFVEAEEYVNDIFEHIPDTGSKQLVFKNGAMTNGGAVKNEYTGETVIYDAENDSRAITREEAKEILKLQYVRDNLKG